MPALHCVRPSWGLAAGLLATALLLQPATAAAGTRWYVDNAAATAGNGQSWATPFKSLSSIPWANVRADDTVYISGGPNAGSKVYTERWSVGASGSAGKPVTIAVDAADARHNGTVVFDFGEGGDKGTGVGINVSNRSYVTFSGNVNGQNRMLLRNLRNVVDRMNATCLSGSGSSSIVVDHVDFENCNNGVRLSGGAAGTGSEVRYSNFRKIRGDVAVMLSMAATTWDLHKVHDNTIELLNNTAVPPGGSGAYVGPDGVQPGDGVSIFNNTFRVSNTSVYTSNQHTDDIQFGMSSYLKIYNNEFINVGDSVIDLGTWGTNVRISNVWIYNNIFRTEQKIDPYPQYIRMYANPGNIASITNLKILNNLFLDGEPGWPVIDFNAYGGNPTAQDVEIRNNIFYNTAGIKIDASDGFAAGSFAFSNNVYFPSQGTTVSFRGKSYSTSSWQSTQEPSARLSAPVFMSYAARSPANNLHLAPTDTTARNTGLSLAGYFSADKEGTLRPQDSVWDIGPFEFSGAAAVLQPPRNLTVQ